MNKDQVRTLQLLLSYFCSLLCFCSLLILSGCGPQRPKATPLIQIDLDKSKPDRLLKFYFGGYVSDAGADPFSSGMLIKKDGAYYLDRNHLTEEVRAVLSDNDRNGIIVWNELEPFLQNTYYKVRPAVSTLADLQNEVPYKKGGERWFKLEVDGVMTVARRHIFVDRDAIRSALIGYSENNDQLIYPDDAVFIGEHWDEGQVVETTMMRKRGDGFWDYFVYDADGQLVQRTATEPRALTVPTRCVGCHFGEKKFEPENNYPLPATPGPHGPRGIYTKHPPADSFIVSLLDEHNKRSDTILGLYSTIYLAQLNAAAHAGEKLDEQDVLILELFEQN